jgi:hypothetical protein
MSRKSRMMAVGVLGAPIVLAAVLTFLVYMRPAPGLKVQLTSGDTSQSTGVIAAELTNAASHQVYVVLAFLQNEDRNGNVPKETDVSRGELLGNVYLERGQTCAVQFTLPANSRRSRVMVYYGYAAGALPRLASSYVLRFRPPNWSERRLWRWLTYHGWVTGNIEAEATSPWVRIRSGALKAAGGSSEMTNLIPAPTN